MSEATLEYILEKITTVWSDGSQNVSVEETPNDFIFLKTNLYKDGDFEPLDDYPDIKAKIGLKVSLMRVGIVFKEILVKSNSGLYVAFIYNDVLNVFYSSVNVTEQMALYNAYKKAVVDLMQYSICGYDFGTDENVEHNRPILSLSTSETFNVNDFIVNKLCQDIEQGKISKTIKATLLDKYTQWPPLAKRLPYCVKFFELKMPDKLSRYHLVYGQLFDSDNKSCSPDFSKPIIDSCNFDTDLSKAITKTYLSLLDSVVVKNINSFDIDWTGTLDYNIIYSACHDVHFKETFVKGTNVDVNNTQFSSDNEVMTKSISDFYDGSPIKVSRRQLGINDFYYISTGNKCNLYKITDIMRGLIEENDIYLRKLTEYILQKIKIIK